MSLTMTEKTYWTDRITTLIEQKKRDLLKSAGIDMAEAKSHAANKALVDEGLAQRYTEFVALEKEYEFEKKSLIQAMQQLVIEAGGRGWSENPSSLLQDIGNLTRETYLKQVYADAGIAEQMDGLEKIKVTIEDAIMLSTSHPRLRDLVTKTLNHFGIELPLLDLIG